MPLVADHFIQAEPGTFLTRENDVEDRIIGWTLCTVQGASALFPVTVEGIQDWNTGADPAVIFPDGTVAAPMDAGYKDRRAYAAEINRRKNANP